MVYFRTQFRNNFFGIQLENPSLFNYKELDPGYGNAGITESEI